MEPEERKAMNSCMTLLCRQMRDDEILPKLFAVGVISDADVAFLMVRLRVFYYS
jgi:hypothetical protein